MLDKLQQITKNSSAFLLKAEHYIKDNRLISEGERILCALSGGSDSVTLLYTLVLLKDKLNIQICAAHFHHGIRGSEADRDAEFSEALCKQLGVPFFLGRADVPRASRESGKGLEECARELRYGFLKECMRGNCCNAVATAHHATDNTETVLFHLLRGSGANGLCGIAPKRADGIIRPLLCFSKSEISEFLAVNRIDFVYDSTNSDIEMTRNFIREKLLPLVYEINPSADQAISRLSSSLRADEEFFSSQAAALRDELSLARLSELPAPVLARIIKKEYACSRGENGGQLGFEHISELCALIKSGKRNFSHPLPGGTVAVSDSGALRFIKDAKQSGEGYSLRPEHFGEYSLPCGRFFITDTADALNSWKQANPYAETVAVCTENGIRDITVRSRLPGDKYLRGGIRRAARRELNAASVPVAKRDSLPHFCTPSGIFWIPGLTPGDLAEKMPFNSKNNTKNRLDINFKQLIYIGYTEN